MDGPPGNTAEERGDSFGARLRRAREAAGLAQEELAARAGLSANVVGDLERGEHRHPYPATVRALAAALGLTDAERAALAAAVPRRGQPVAQATAALPGLPTPLFPLVGRESEVAGICSLLRRDEVRLVTLTGPGGVGKTRLALQVAADLAGDFAHGAAFVSLAAVRDPSLVGPTIAHVLGVVEGSGRAPVDRLGDALRERHLLLVLDNYEQVLDAAPLVTDLLARCPRLAVLATSRTALRLDGERVFPVPPLAVPDPERRLVAEQVSDVAAVRLFVDRARDADPAFALTDRNAGAVAAVCHRLDGLPLAIELAAARSTLFAPEAMLPRLARRLPLLTGGRRDGPARHRTMRDAIAWSHDLLNSDDRALFRRLAVFVGGFSHDAAEAVAGVGEPEDVSSPTLSVSDGVAALVDASLLRTAGSGGAPRFSMLETIRGFALEQLDGSGEADAVNSAHADWCLDLAEQSGLASDLPGGEQHLRRLEVEHANLRAALDWLHQRGDGDRLLRLAAALGGFWHAHGHYREGRAWLERALQGTQGASTHARARALVELGHLLYWQGEPARAEELLGESIATLREHGDVVTLTGVLVWQGWIASHRGDYAEAERVLEEVLGLAATIPEPAIAASVTGKALANLGVAAHGRGDLDAARVRHELALRSYRKSGDVLGVIRSLRDRGDVARDQGDYAAAVASYRESLALLGDQGDLGVVVDALQGSALAAAVWHQPERAARLLGAAEAVRDQLGVAIVVPADRAAHERAVALVHATLGDQDLQAAWSVGRGLSLAAAIAEVQTLAPPAAASEETGDRSDVNLSHREQEVLRLLVAGNTDREIAEALFLSVRTVEAHVTHLFAKLGVHTRTAAAAAAVAAGLVDPRPPTTA